MSSLKRWVGDGEQTSFWNDGWISERPLHFLFPRLYDLCLDKDCSVGSAGKWEDQGWIWGVGWRRELRDWEAESLTEMSMLLSCRNSAPDSADRWNWKLEAKGEFSVRISYRLLVDRKTIEGRTMLPWTKDLWSCWAVRKAKATALRVLVGRIATKVELARRGVLPGTNCPLCGEDDETINHLFLACKRSWELWMRCLEWLGVHAPLPGKVAEHFSVFCHLGGRKRTCKLLATIWSCVVWSIWKIRNEVVFNNGKWDRDKLVEELSRLCGVGGPGKRFTV